MVQHADGTGSLADDLRDRFHIKIADDAEKDHVRLFRRE
jgi:hypothetical protein